MLEGGDRGREEKGVYIRGLDAGGNKGRGGKAADPSVRVGSGRGCCCCSPTARDS